MVEVGPNFVRLITEKRRRLAEYNANSEAGVPWEDVKTEINELLQDRGE